MWLTRREAVSLGALAITLVSFWSADRPAFGKWHRTSGGQRGCNGGGLGGCQVERRQGGLDVQAVATARARLRPDRHAGFLKRQQVALDGTRGDLEPLGQLGGAHKTWRVGAQILDQRIQPIGAVHGRTVAENSEVRTQLAFEATTN